MAHILARIVGIKYDDIEMVLLSDAAEHAERGMNLEHLWKNADNEDETLFLFSANDLDKARTYIEEMNKQVLDAFPNMIKPEINYLF